MLKKSVTALCIFMVAGAAHAAAPTKDQVKQALYDRYATVLGGENLRTALHTEVAVGACEPKAEAYRCTIQNTALGTSTPMTFSYDQAEKKWKFIKEEDN